MPLSVYNSTADTIPPGGAMEPIGLADANGLVQVRKPTRSDSTTILVNGLTPILPFTAGAGFLPWEPLLSLGLDPADLDSDGVYLGLAANFGTIASSWYFKPGRFGFVPTAKSFLGILPAIVGLASPAIISGSAPASGASGTSFPEGCDGLRTYVSDVACSPDGGIRVTKTIENKKTCEVIGSYFVDLGACPPPGSGGSTGSGSAGSAGSGGGTITNGCCGGAALPAAPNLVISGGITASFPMTYNSGASSWSTGLVTLPGGCGTVNLVLQCSGGSLSLGNGVGGTVAFGGYIATDVTVCSPFSFRQDGAFTGACPAPVTITVS